MFSFCTVPREFDLSIQIFHVFPLIRIILIVRFFKRFVFKKFDLEMPSNFFLRKKAKSGPTKRKKEESDVSSKKKKIEKIKPGQEEISSDEDDSGHEAGYPEESSSEEETEQEKKLRLAKKYLEKIAEEEREKNSLDDTREAVAQRLKDEVLEEAGRLQKKKAHEYENIVLEPAAIFKGHKLSITALVVSSSEKTLFSVGKDCNIIKWSLEEKKKLKVIPFVKKGSEETKNGHSGHILSLALSSDDKFLASGCSNKIINIWNPETLEHLKTFKGHKGAITGLAFQRNSHQLISASSDRSLKLWNLDEMSYIETLFGHQDEVSGIDCFLGENAVTCGGRDNTVRIWKLAEESQLVFQGHGASIDCVAVSSFQSFVSGGDDGSLLLWGTQKKKPMCKVPLAHGEDEESEVPNWIVSVTSLQNTDLVASGSRDGFIRLWRRDDETHSLVQISKIPVIGFVNSLKFSASGKYLIAGIGQEHRLGRWWRIKEAKNSIVLYTFENKS